MESIHLSQALKQITVEFKDLRDDQVLRAILEDIKTNIHQLHETKADADTTRRVLADKVHNTMQKCKFFAYKRIKTVDFLIVLNVREKINRIDPFVCEIHSSG